MAAQGLGKGGNRLIQPQEAACPGLEAGRGRCAGIHMELQPGRAFLEAQAEPGRPALPYHALVQALGTDMLGQTAWVAGVASTSNIAAFSL